MRKDREWISVIDYVIAREMALGDPAEIRGACLGFQRALCRAPNSTSPLVAGIQESSE